jgi:hypothetical protein
MTEAELMALQNGMPTPIRLASPVDPSLLTVAAPLELPAPPPQIDTASLGDQIFDWRVGQPEPAPLNPDVFTGALYDQTDTTWQPPGTPPGTPVGPQGAAPPPPTPGPQPPIRGVTATRQAGRDVRQAAMAQAAEERARAGQLRQYRREARQYGPVTLEQPERLAGELTQEQQRLARVRTLGDIGLAVGPTALQGLGLLGRREGVAESKAIVARGEEGVRAKGDAAAEQARRDIEPMISAQLMAAARQNAALQATAGTGGTSARAAQARLRAGAANMIQAAGQVAQFVYSARKGATDEARNLLRSARATVDETRKVRQAWVGEIFEGMAKGAGMWQAGKAKEQLAPELAKLPPRVQQQVMALWGRARTAGEVEQAIELGRRMALTPMSSEGGTAPVLGGKPASTTAALESGRTAREGAQEQIDLLSAETPDALTLGQMEGADVLLGETAAGEIDVDGQPGTLAGDEIASGILNLRHTPPPNFFAGIQPGGETAALVQQLPPDSWRQMDANWSYAFHPDAPGSRFFKDAATGQIYGPVELKMAAMQWAPTASAPA